MEKIKVELTLTRRDAMVFACNFKRNALLQDRDPEEMEIDKENYQAICNAASPELRQEIQLFAAKAAEISNADLHRFALSQERKKKTKRL